MYDSWVEGMLKEVQEGRRSSSSSSSSSASSSGRLTPSSPSPSLRPSSSSSSLPSSSSPPSTHLYLQQQYDELLSLGLAFLKAPFLPPALLSLRARQRLALLRAQSRARSLSLTMSLLRDDQEGGREGGREGGITHLGKAVTLMFLTGAMRQTLSHPSLYTYHIPPPPSSSSSSSSSLGAEASTQQRARTSACVQKQRGRQYAWPVRGAFP